MNNANKRSSLSGAADTYKAQTRTEVRTVKAGASGTSKQAARNLWLMKKTVLLIDLDSATREARAKVMRALGVTVHSAPSVASARQKLESGSFDLVLVDLGSDIDGAKALVEEIRTKNSRQLVAFLVGSPLFVATSLDGQPLAAPKAHTPQVAPVRRADPPKSNVFDFGQKIRDAEAKKIA